MPKKPKSNPSDEFTKATFIPTVIDDDDKYERPSDVLSRLLKDRSIFLFDEVNQGTAAIIAGQLMFLGAQLKDSGKEINFYIMTPGGDIDAGMAIYDTMQYVQDQYNVPINTFAFGRSMSMGSILLVAGTPGHRFAMPNANIMLHSPAGGSQGKTSDTDNNQRESNHYKSRMAIVYEAHTNLTRKGAMQIMDRPDFFLRAEEAQKLGIVDTILYPEHNPVVKAAIQNANREHEAMRNQPSPGLPPDTPPLPALEVKKPPKPANQP